MVGIELRLLYKNHVPRKAPYSLKSRLENINPTAQGIEKENLLVWSGFSVGKKNCLWAYAYPVLEIKFKLSPGHFHISNIHKIMVSGW